MPTIALVCPEIPQNTGNIIRLCANTGSDLCLIKPLGFEFDDKRLRRAHLYYDEFADVKILENWQEFYEQFSGSRIFAVETGGNRSVFDIQYNKDDVLVFGSESSGLCSSILSDIGYDNILHLPMFPGSRSLNLANCVSIVLYEMWRQDNFFGSVNANLKFGFAN